MFPDVLGHEHARTVLGRLLRSGRIPHALLFHGPDGVGKGWIARLIARSLVCATPTADGGACGTCLCLPQGRARKPPRHLHRHPALQEGHAGRRSPKPGTKTTPRTRRLPRAVSCVPSSSSSRSAS